MKTKEPKITEKTFCEVMKQLLKNKETKALYDKTFERKRGCQLKK